jgi:hypothetical protein
MATKVKRVSDFAKHGMNYLFRRDQISPLEKERNREKTWLKEYIDENGVLDSNGNRNVYFERDGGVKFVPGPGQTQYWGLQQRRVPGSEYMNTDEVRLFAETLHPALRDQIVYEKTIEVVDIDVLYVLQAQKKITKAELRKLIHHHDDTFQLWPITDEPMDEDED